MEQRPEITVYDHVGSDASRVAGLQRFAECAVERVLRMPAAGAPPSPLQRAGELEVSLVSDERIAKVHGDFMGIPDATDVITFQHGEILVSVDTAEVQAGVFTQSVEKELALYIAHGLLHLHGYQDDVSEQAELMRELQEQVLAELWFE